MDLIMRERAGNSIRWGRISVFVLVLAVASCSSPSEPPVEYADYSTLQGDCAALLTAQQTASVSGALNIRESTPCITDRDGERCKLLLGSQDSGLDIWMNRGGRNAMEKLPDPYFASDLAVHADDGDKLTAGDMVTLTLEPFSQEESGGGACAFRVQTILRSRIEAAEGQPGEGAVNLRIPANVPWYDTGVYVNKGQRLMLFGGLGMYNLQGGNPDWDAIGWTMLGVTDMACETDCAIDGEDYGMLVGRIGEGQPFLVTVATSDLIVPANGTLFLTVNDCASCYEDNSGTFGVILDLTNAS